MSQTWHIFNTDYTCQKRSCFRFQSEDAIKENRKLKQTVKQCDKDICIARLQLVNSCGQIPSEDFFRVGSERTERFKDGSIPRYSEKSKMQVTSCGSLQDVFILLDGVSILFDPLEDVLLKDSSIRRYKPRYVQGLGIDVVVLSTCINSFTETTVKEIMQSYPGVKWLIPSERKHFLIDIGADENSIIALGMWEEKSVPFGQIEITKITFACTPTSINTSSQGKMCNDCGWIIKGPKRTFYFSGITNYNATHFKEIGKRYHPIHMALLPVADRLTNMSCLPEFTISTEEVLDMHVDLQPKQSFGIRKWCCLDYHHHDYLLYKRKEELSKQMKDRQIELHRFGFMEPGQTYED